MTGATDILGGKAGQWGQLLVCGGHNATHKEGDLGCISATGVNLFAWLVDALRRAGYGSQCNQILVTGLWQLPIDCSVAHRPFLRARGDHMQGPELNVD